jgi:hypothetical protein
MPSTTQNFVPTLGVDKKIFVRKIVISLNMWFKRHGLCKSMKKWKKIIGTHEGPKVCEKKKKMMIAISQNKKLERDHIYKMSIA